MNSLFTDGSAIALSIALGPPRASVVHWLILAPWACLVLWALHHRIMPEAVAEWVQRRERALGPRTQRLLHWGKAPAVLALGATVGPLSALLAIHVLGIGSPRRYLLAIYAAAAYCIVWTGLVYSGGWLLIQHLWAQLHP